MITYSLSGPTATYMPLPALLRTPQSDLSKFYDQAQLSQHLRLAVVANCKRYAAKPEGMLARAARLGAMFFSVYNSVCGEIFGRIERTDPADLIQQAIDENADRESSGSLEELLRLVRVEARFDAIVLQRLTGSTGDECAHALLQHHAQQVPSKKQLAEARRQAKVDELQKSKSDARTSKAGGHKGRLKSLGQGVVASIKEQRTGKAMAKYQALTHLNETIFPWARHSEEIKIANDAKERAEQERRGCCTTGTGSGSGVSTKTKVLAADSASSEEDALSINLSHDKAMPPGTRIRLGPRCGTVVGFEKVIRPVHYIELDDAPFEVQDLLKPAQPEQDEPRKKEVTKVLLRKNRSFAVLEEGYRTCCGTKQKKDAKGEGTNNSDSKEDTTWTTHVPAAVQVSGCPDVACNGIYVQRPNRDRQHYEQQPGGKCLYCREVSEHDIVMDGDPKARQGFCRWVITDGALLEHGLHDDPLATNHPCMVTTAGSFDLPTGKRTWRCYKSERRLKEICRKDLSIMAAGTLTKQALSDRLLKGHTHGMDDPLRHYRKKQSGGTNASATVAGKDIQPRDLWVVEFKAMAHAPGYLTHAGFNRISRRVGWPACSEYDRWQDLVVFSLDHTLKRALRELLLTLHVDGPMSKFTYYESDLIDLSAQELRQKCETEPLKPAAIARAERVSSRLPWITIDEFELTNVYRHRLHQLTDLAVAIKAESGEDSSGDEEVNLGRCGKAKKGCKNYFHKKASRLRAEVTSASYGLLICVTSLQCAVYAIIHIACGLLAITSRKSVEHGYWIAFGGSAVVQLLVYGVYFKVKSSRFGSGMQVSLSVANLAVAVSMTAFGGLGVANTQLGVESAVAFDMLLSGASSNTNIDVRYHKQSPGLLDSQPRKEAFDKLLATDVERRLQYGC